MFIYKITNKINNKIYIGQTAYAIEKRFQRHINDALNNNLNTHLANAIRKYGKDAFTIEKIDTASNQQELNEKEHYYIHYYNTLQDGYNETDSIAKCGGNTYAGRTKEKMDITKEKLSKSKMGGKNPRARRVKCKNVNTQEELHFDSFSEMQRYFNEKQHNFITRRCNHITKCLYKKEWAIAYEEDNYLDFTVNKNIARNKSIKVINLITKEEKIYSSRSEAERSCGIPNRKISSKLRYSPSGFIIDNYEIVPIN